MRNRNGRWLRQSPGWKVWSNDRRACEYAEIASSELSHVVSLRVCLSTQSTGDANAVQPPIGVERTSGFLIGESVSKLSYLTHFDGPR